jgi:galactokinase/mevalonate kinase-like predicted kinase
MAFSLKDMQDFASGELEYILKDIAGSSVDKIEIIEEVEDEYRIVSISVSINDIETTHRSSILFEINYEEQQYYIIFGEDNRRTTSDINMWQSLFFNKEEGDDVIQNINNLQAVIDKIKKDNISNKIDKHTPSVSRGWK